MQIGPRIRVGGSLGKLGNKVKKGIQKVASNPWVQAGLGVVTGGATVPLLAGALGGGLKEHAGFGDVASGAIKGGAAGYGGSKLKGVFNSARGALSSVGRSSLDKLPTAIPNVGTIASPGTSVVSAAPKASGFLSSVGSFVKNNPTAAGMGLQAAGNLATAGAENRMNDAQADILEQRADETRYDFEQRKRREAELQGLWSPLGTAIGSSYAGVAKNPYAVGA